MLVRDWMSKEVITVNADDSMYHATQKLKENNIRILPVMKSDKLVGVITDRDLKRSSASDATTLEIHELLYALSRIKVGEIMTKDPITVPPDFTVEETAEVILKSRISGVPVLDEQSKVVGVITKTDLFKVLISLTGISKRGIQFAFLLDDRPGSIKEVADIIRKHGARMVSILSTYDEVQEGYRKVYIRIYDIQRPKLQELKEELKKEFKVLYMVDLRENKREIYG